VLLAVFPDKANEIKTRKSIRFWTSVDRQRQWMDDFARANGIQTEEDWYLVRNKDILRAGGSGLLGHYNGSMTRRTNNGFHSHYL
jgi:hypothetical protein